MAGPGRWVAAVIALVWGILVLLWEPALWSLLCDDSFYYWQIARNLAEGRGSTFDGIHLTNGYHPLWMGICAVVLSLPVDGWTAAVLTVVLQAGLLAFGLAVGASVVDGALRACPSEVDPWLRRVLIAGLLALGLSQPVVKLWVNGLESAVYLAAYAPLVALAASAEDWLEAGQRRRRGVAAVLLSLAFLARTDAALMLPAIAVWSVPRLVRSPMETARSLVELLLLPSLVVLTFMGLNQAWFGSAVQVSGLLKRAPLEGWRVVGAVLCVGMMPVGRVLLQRAAPFDRVRWVWDRTGWFGLFGASLCAYYGALQLFPRLWYFGPPVFWMGLIGGAAVADLLVQARREAPRSMPLRAMGPLVALVAVPMAIVLGSGVQAVVSAPSAEPLYANRDAARWVAEHLPEDAVLASWDAGVVGWFAQRPVVNLDGVVNTVDYLEALKAGRAPEYLRPSNIHWILNHHDADGEELLRQRAEVLLGAEAAGRWRVVERWPFQVYAPVNGVVPAQQDMAVYLVALGQD